MVSTAPLCGSESKLTDAMAVRRCMSSMSMPPAAAICCRSSPNVDSVMLRPPDDEPVMPEITPVDRIDTTRALSLTEKMPSRSTANTARDAITAP